MAVNTLGTSYRRTGETESSSPVSNSSDHRGDSSSPSSLSPQSSNRRRDVSIPPATNPQPSKRHKQDISSSSRTKYSMGFLHYSDVLTDGFYDCGFVYSPFSSTPLAPLQSQNEAPANAKEPSCFPALEPPSEEKKNFVGPRAQKPKNENFHAPRL